MAGKVENRIFVGGLSWETTERHLEDAFDCYGKILESQIMLERDTGRPRGFGFVTFADQRGMEDAIREMHGQELGGRVISVNKAQPKMGVDDTGFGYGGGYSSGSQNSYGAGDRPVGRSDCFKCGRPGHWARECPTGNGISSGGSRFPAPRRFVGGGGRGDGFGGGRYGDRYDDDRYNGARYADRDRLDRRDSRYGGNDRYDRYPAGGDRFGGDRYGGSGQRPQSGYGKDRGYGRGGGARRGRDRYGSGGPARYEGGSFRDRPGPYDRPPPIRGGRPPSFEPY